MQPFAGNEKRETRGENSRGQAFVLCLRRGTWEKVVRFPDPQWIREPGSRQKERDQTLGDKKLERIRVFDVSKRYLDCSSVPKHLYSVVYQNPLRTPVTVLETF